MRQFLAVFKFEYKSITSKGFIAFTIVIALLLASVLSYPRIKDTISQFKSDEDSSGSDKNESIVAIINKTEHDSKYIITAFEEDGAYLNLMPIDSTLEEAQTKVASGEYEHIIFIEALNDITLISQKLSMGSSFSRDVESIMMNLHQLELLRQVNISDEDSQAILNPDGHLEIINMGKDQRKTFFYAYAMVFLLYMTLLLYGQFIAVSVAREKSSRAMEVLVSTVKPITLMFGKVFGAGTAALSQLVFVIGSGLFFYQLNSSYWADNFIVASFFDVPPTTVGVSIIMFLLGFFVYAFIFAAVGSIVSRIEDLNVAIQPIVFMSIITFMITMFSMSSGNVDSALMKFCSYFPLTSPYALIARFTMGETHLWEGIISIAILFITLLAVGYMSTMIFRIGVLLYGNKPSIKRIFTLLRNK